MADVSALRLKRIDAVNAQSLEFVFDSADGERFWVFAPGSIAEFLALLLGGGLRGGHGVSIPNAGVSVKPRGKAGGAELSVSVGPVDLISALDVAGLKALAAGVAHALGSSGKS